MLPYFTMGPAWKERLSPGVILQRNICIALADTRRIGMGQIGELKYGFFTFVEIACSILLQQPSIHVGSGLRKLYSSTTGISWTENNSHFVLDPIHGWRRLFFSNDRSRELYLDGHFGNAPTAFGKAFEQIWF
jgi:hypothetical protein